MRSIVFILYVVCFGCYVLFTRQPDYFDSGRAVGTIIKMGDKMFAKFNYGSDIYYASVPYNFMYGEGQRKGVIYETADPSNATVYSLFGYWISIGELVASIVIVSVLYFVAVSITRNPTPEALMEEIEMGKPKPRKPKYD